MNSRLFFACSALLFAAFVGPASDFPLLNITSQSSNLIVSWPLLPQWVLEEAPDLVPPTPWTLVSPSYYQSNGASRFVNYSSAVGSRYFRLRKTGLSVPGLTGYWGLDEGTGQVSLDGTELGSSLLFTNVSWGVGRIGPGALKFTGSPPGPSASRAWISNDNYQVLPAAANPWSLSLWLNPNELPPGWNGIAGNNATGTNGWQLLLNNFGPGTNFFVFTSTGLPTSLSITGRFLLLPGQWHQLTVTHDGTQGSIYLDSALLGRGEGPLAMHNGPIYFGGGVANLNSFLGRIDDLRLYTNSLSHEQISLTGCWHFEETNGQTCLDSSIQGHSATLADPSARVSGHNGIGVDLSKSQVTIGNQDYAVLPPNGGSFSISFWLRPTAIGRGWSGLMKLGEGPIGGFDLAFLADDSGRTFLHFASTNAGGTLDMLAPVLLSNGAWTKLDLTFNGGIATLYANGKQIKAINGAIRGTKSPLLLGNVPGLTPFNGIIDDLKIYSRERGPSEIGPIANTMWETVMLNSSTNLQLQGDGPPGRNLTYSIVPVITPTNGTIALEGNTFTYSAGARKGPDAFTYTVSDGEFTSDPAIVTMSVVQPHWLSPTGGWIEPQDGSSPLQAWLAGPADATDAILKTNNYYDCFFYAPGEYQTRGWKFLERSTANPGCKHVGSGATGVEETTLKLVDIWDAWGEEVIFGTLAGTTLCDNFEVHHMTLDCNATNVPKYYQGEPVWLRIPLSSTSQVDKVLLRWDNSSIYGNTFWQLGRAHSFELYSLQYANGATQSNKTSLLSTGQVDVINLGATADEIILQLTSRAFGIDFYALREVEVLGNSVSLPTALLTNGVESRFDPGSSILLAVDQNPSTAWISGPDPVVRITLPFDKGSSFNHLDLRWNCKTISGKGRVGPAAFFSIQWRDEKTGQYVDAPIISQGRQADGLEQLTFGTESLTNFISTDQLVILLTSREAGVDLYSLKEITARAGPAPVPFRLPSALNSLVFGDYNVLRAFDGDPGSQWASATQGSVAAARVAGSNLRFADLRIIGFGTKAFRECFGMDLSPLGPPSQRVGNILVERCVFTQPAPVNKDGVTAFSLMPVKPRTSTNAVVRGCTFSGLQSHFSYSQAMQATHVENTLVSDCQRGVYFEPETGYGDDVGPVYILSNRFENVSSGVYLYMHPATRFESLTLLGNEIILNGTGGWGLAACDVCDPGLNGRIGSVTALNNVIRYPGWSPNPSGLDGGLLYSDIRHALFGNNVIALGTANGLRLRHYPAGLIPPDPPKEDCDNPGPFSPGTPTYPPALDSLSPGYERVWFNNRDLSGAGLNVRYIYFGNDQPASQQQWPE